MRRLRIFAAVLALASAVAVALFWTVFRQRAEMYYEAIHIAVYHFVSLPALVFSLVLLVCLVVKVRIYGTRQRKVIAVAAVVVGAVYAIAVGALLAGVQLPDFAVFIMSTTIGWLPPVIAAFLGASAGLVAKG